MSFILLYFTFELVLEAPFHWRAALTKLAAFKKLQLHTLQNILDFCKNLTTVSCLNVCF